MYFVIDIETENTGSDIMKDNKRILSIQIGDDTKQELYYADSTDSQWTLKRAKIKIASLLSQNSIFTGYNLKNFDLHFLKHFLGVEIPQSNIFDLSDTPQIRDFRNNTIFSLEDVCSECSIVVTHKHKMNKKAESYKTRQDIRDQAYTKAKEIVRTRGWSWDFSFNRVLDKIAGGIAIYDAYQDFVRRGGQKNTLFYEYAIGDVICEYRLLKALKY
jgi:hypothetical protein